VSSDQIWFYANSRDRARIGAVFAARVLNHRLRPGYQHSGPMLLDNPTLQAIMAGRVSVVFRTWRRPTVKTGGTLRTRAGVLAIEAVDSITPERISKRDIEQAGFGARAELLQTLQGRTGELYRIRVRPAGEDPRIALRQQPLGAAELAQVEKRLQRMDAASREGPWTRQYLELIEARPTQRAPELAELMGLTTKPFKQRVRRLKELGLTESLRVGYRLSPRGESYLRARRLPRTAAGARSP
jgi:hypothetical protein